MCKYFTLILRLSLNYRDFCGVLRLIIWILGLRLLMIALTTTGFLDLFKGCACTFWTLTRLLLEPQSTLTATLNTFCSKVQRVGSLSVFLRRAILALLPSLRFMNTYAFKRIFVLTCRISLWISFCRLNFTLFMTDSIYFRNWSVWVSVPSLL